MGCLRRLERCVLEISPTESCFLVLAGWCSLEYGLETADFFCQSKEPLSRNFSSCSFSLVCLRVSKERLEKIELRFLSCSSSKKERDFLEDFLPFRFDLNRLKFSLMTFSIKADLFF